MINNKRAILSGVVPCVPKDDPRVLAYQNGRVKLTENDMAKIIRKLHRFGGLSFNVISVKSDISLEEVERLYKLGEELMDGEI
jgi:hypothetical protein